MAHISHAVSHVGHRRPHGPGGGQGHGAIDIRIVLACLGTMWYPNNTHQGPKRINLKMTPCYPPVTINNGDFR
jgi:hypothetical protein